MGRSIPSSELMERILRDCRPEPSKPGAAANKLLWVNHGTNAAPTSGQAGAYMLFNYDLNGNMTLRERRFPGGTFQSYDLYWDGADNLAQINVHGGSEIFSAGYNGDGLRVGMQDTASGSFPTQHNFSWGLGGFRILSSGGER